MKITLKRAEGPNEWVGNLSIVQTFAQANDVLKTWSDTAPKKGGCDKCDFSIQINGDCVEYDGRYDLSHWSSGFPDLKAHIVRRLKAMGGDDAARMAGILKGAV